MQNLQLILQGAFLLGVIVLILICKKTINSYLNQKGKNLATKEDLAKITSIAESIKSDFDKINAVHKIQFDAEFKAYQEIWECAFKTNVELIRWKPVTSLAQQDPSDFENARINYTLAITRNTPFIFESVLKEFKNLDDVLVDIKSDEIFGLPTNVDTISNNRKVVGAALDNCIKAIKKRLSELLVIKD